MKRMIIKCMCTALCAMIGSTAAGMRLQAIRTQTNADVTAVKPAACPASGAGFNVDNAETESAYWGRQHAAGAVIVDEESGVNPSPYVPSTVPYESGEELPSAYKTYTTGVKNQGSYNSCWAFSGIGTFEAYLSSQGRGDHDLSEQHLMWWSTKAYNTDGIGWLAPNLSYGGYSMMSAGYFVSWQGPKTEEEVPYYGTGNNTPPDNMDAAKTVFAATSIMYVNNDIDSVKNAVYHYGGVATSYNNGSGYNNNKACYYQSNAASRFSGHAITIIGWDDNYSRENFKESDRPEYDGAWLAKNSWGPEKADEGYTWISYYDRYVLDVDVWGVNLAITGVRTINEFDKLYQNEQYGATYYTFLKDNNGVLPTATFANVFNFDDEHKYLQEVIFETQAAGAEYEVFYIPLKNGLPVTDETRWTSLGGGTVTNTGYISVDVSGKVEVSGKAAIAVRIDASETDTQRAEMGVDEWLNKKDGDYIFMPKQRRNQSFVINGGSVYDLVDIYGRNNDKIGGTLVIKAIASSDVMGDADDDAAVSAPDALIVLRGSIGESQLDEYHVKKTDVNFDGIITSDDALLVLRRSVGLIKEF